MLPLIAIPVIHSSGAWIASTAASGYLASTLSASWVGAFVAGNAGLLAGLGGAAAAGIGGFFAGAGSAVSSATTSVGVSLGIISQPWLWPAVAGVSAVALGAAVYAYMKKDAIIQALEESLEEINAEREKGGLSSFDSVQDLLIEVFSFDKEKEEAEKGPYLRRLLGEAVSDEEFDKKAKKSWYQFWK